MKQIVYDLLTRKGWKIGDIRGAWYTCIALLIVGVLLVVVCNIPKTEVTYTFDRMIGNIREYLPSKQPDLLSIELAKINANNAKAKTHKHVATTPRSQFRGDEGCVLPHGEIVYNTDCNNSSSEGTKR